MRMPDMAAADSSSSTGTQGADDASIQRASVPSTDSVEGSFAKGMYISLWPKIERCHNYVSVLLAAQEQLQETVGQLIAGLKEAEEAEASSLVGYADRLKNFPVRVEKLQHKLELIEDRLMALKNVRNRSNVGAVSQYRSADAGSAQTASPLF